MTNLKRPKHTNVVKSTCQRVNMAAQVNSNEVSVENNDQNMADNSGQLEEKQPEIKDNGLTPKLQVKTPLTGLEQQFLGVSFHIDTCSYQQIST